MKLNVGLIGKGKWGKIVEQKLNARMNTNLTKPAPVQQIKKVRPPTPKPEPIKKVSKFANTITPLLGTNKKLIMVIEFCPQHLIKPIMTKFEC